MELYPPRGYQCFCTLPYEETNMTKQCNNKMPKFVFNLICKIKCRVFSYKLVFLFHLPFDECFNIKHGIELRRAMDVLTYSCFCKNCLDVSQALCCFSAAFWSCTAAMCKAPHESNSWAFRVRLCSRPSIWSETIMKIPPQS